MDQELALLIDTILSRTMMTTADLETELQLTKRQLLYRLDKLNTLVQNHGYPAIVVGAAKELQMASETRKFLLSFYLEHPVKNQYYFNKQERMIYIYLLLFMNSDYVSLQHFIQGLQISRSTVLLDLKDLQEELDHHEIKVANNREKGYFLQGDELHLRSYMMKQVMLSLSNEKNMTVFNQFIDDLHIDTFAYSKLVISELSEKHQLVFVGDRLDEFIYIFILLKARINSGLQSEQPVLPGDIAIESMKEYVFTTQLLTCYKNIEGMSERERYYISAWILAVSIGNVDEDTPDKALITDIVHRIMTRFEFLSGSYYKDTKEIFKQLYSHLRPAYYRLKYKLPIFNPLRSKIQLQYKDFYSLVEETMRPLNVLFDTEIPEDELAYLTVHFAAIFSKQRVSDEIPQKRALVVCTNGIGSSAILYHQLQEMFPELYFYDPIEYNKMHEYEDVVDIIFTTISQSNMMNPDIPIIRVSPIMDMREKYDVMGEVYARLKNPMFKQPNIDVIIDIIKKHGEIKDEASLYHDFLQYFSSPNRMKNKQQEDGLLLSDIIGNDQILLQIEASDWKEAILQASKPLIENGAVNYSYVQKIIEINEGKPQAMVIAQHIAIPHTKPEFGANRCAMGIATVKQPLPFGESENNPVKYIFFLSALDNHQHLPAMSQLLALFNEEHFFQILDHAKSAEEILSYIKHQELHPKS